MNKDCHLKIISGLITFEEVSQEPWVVLNQAFLHLVTNFSDQNPVTNTHIKNNWVSFNNVLFCDE